MLPDATAADSTLTELPATEPSHRAVAVANHPEAREAGARVAEAAALMAHLRGPSGCPWDREQTFDSIKRNTLEETYEVFDAIERRAWPELRDELGDLLLQVLFYAQMASESGHFTLADVAEGLSAKLVRRHPHLFADATAKDAAAVQATWDAVKQQERRTAGTAQAGLLDEVSRAMPAMIEATKLGSRAARVGFDWPNALGLLEKVREEAQELEAELQASAPERLEDELGDLLFTCVNLARHLRLDPETALRRANAKFRGRFGAMERVAGGREGLSARTPEQLEALWSEAKQAETKREHAQ